ncbi:hypothetical protein D1AOALGA4SA_236 [Olavius algarvensis Delta 1 endosymbiont]|nr:hypothetical protein D1AOALGA4SA_236 [Olavius algarvensis Delta 1 endosymbiont]
MVESLRSIVLKWIEYIIRYSIFAFSMFLFSDQKSEWARLAQL